MKKDDSELFEKMHIAGKLAARTLDEQIGRASCRERV